jgi:group II intron reverse transcriptase/maturase
MDRTGDEATMQTKLTLIAEIARRDHSAKINNVAYLLNEANLRECFDLLKEGKATGIDGVGIEEYGRTLDQNLKNLVARLKSQAYKPQPVRRTYIPKSNGKMRPLGIPATEDKLVQVGIARILEAIYEADFLDCSYGFRPKRNCHQAVERLDKIIMKMPINHVIDCDIKGFFDNVSHSWMLKFLGHRVSDPNLLRLIARFLRNGYMEEGTFHESVAGTPQGGIVSPILANVYLHYALDLWVERVVKPRCRGIVEIVRYADDFVICVQHKDEAEKILKVLRRRLAKFSLELSEEKTRIIEFGRLAGLNSKRNGTKPETFNFLGFTHFVDTTRSGLFKVGRKTDRKKMAVKLKEMNLWLKDIRNRVPIREWWAILKAKLSGHFRYYGISGNSRSIMNFFYRVRRLVFKWINRRSQKKCMDWAAFSLYVKRHELPKPRIFHNLYTLTGS